MNKTSPPLAPAAIARPAVPKSGRAPAAAASRSRTKREEAAPIPSKAPKTSNGHTGEGSRASDENLADMNAILVALSALKKGNFSVRLPVTWTSTAGKVSLIRSMMWQTCCRPPPRTLSRTSHVVGKEGRKLSERLTVGQVGGAWAERVNSVNTLIACLVTPISETARVIGAVAKGDLSQTMALEVQGRPLEGEFLRTAKTVNLMVDQLGAFASEVTRVAREVGTEGKLGGQA